VQAFNAHLDSPNFGLYGTKNSGHLKGDILQWCVCVLWPMERTPPQGGRRKAGMPERKSVPGMNKTKTFGCSSRQWRNIFHPVRGFLERDVFLSYLRRRESRSAWASRWKPRAVKAYTMQLIPTALTISSTRFVSSSFQAPFSASAAV